MRFNKIFEFETIDSTNSYARSIAANATEGTVVTAGIQTGGRGRGDNLWSSDRGGLYLSVILKPGLPLRQTLPLTLVAALAVSDALKGRGLMPRIKWPNDILVEDKKIAGILCEAGSSGPESNYIIIGMGINLENQIPPGLPATSLLEETQEKVDMKEFRTCLLEIFASRYQIFMESGFGDMAEEWVKAAGVSGRAVRERKSGKTLGRFLGLAPDGGVIYRPGGNEAGTLTATSYETELDFLEE